MWIRTQDKMNLIEVQSFQICYIKNEDEEYWEIYTIGISLGKYKSRERALEILDEIQRLIEDLKYMEYAIDKNKFCGYRSNVYRMPEV